MRLPQFYSTQGPLQPARTRYLHALATAMALSVVFPLAAAASPLLVYHMSEETVARFFTSDQFDASFWSPWSSTEALRDALELTVTQNGSVVAGTPFADEGAQTTLTVYGAYAASGLLLYLRIRDAEFGTAGEALIDGKWVPDAVDLFFDPTESIFIEGGDMAGTYPLGNRHSFTYMTQGLSIPIGGNTGVPLPFLRRFYSYEADLSTRTAYLSPVGTHTDSLQGRLHEESPTRRILELYIPWSLLPNGLYSTDEGTRFAFSGGYNAGNSRGDLGLLRTRQGTDPLLCVPSRTEGACRPWGDIELGPPFEAVSARPYPVTGSTALPSFWAATPNVLHTDLSGRALATSQRGFPVVQLYSRRKHIHD